MVRPTVNRTQSRITKNVSKTVISGRRVTYYAADFETTTDPADCRVWLWGLTPVKEDGKFEWGTDIDSFVERMSVENTTTYFHNLAFDGVFIISWLLENGFEHVSASPDNDLSPKTFTTLISDQGKYYTIRIRWNDRAETELRDSLKKLPFTLKTIADAFELPVSKGEIDYGKPREPGYQPTETELEYQRLDVVILALAMRRVLSEGFTRLTVGADALGEFTKLIGGKDKFRQQFPCLPIETDTEIRRAYRGGFTYVDPRHKQRMTEPGLVLDVNSLYPYVMSERALPYGEPSYFDGAPPEYLGNKLAIFSVFFTATIKPKHIPCIQLTPAGSRANPVYETVISEPMWLDVTNVDWKLINDQYDVDVYGYGGGWLFASAFGMFKKYINKWSEIKANSTGALRALAKLQLNSLYGKFGSNPTVSSKVPYLDGDGVVRYRTTEPETKEPIYTAVAVFTTSWARDLTIRAAQDNYDTFAYADTDSLHLLTETLPDTLDIDPNVMGAWKHEYNFMCAFFIRAKAYLERKADGSYKTAFAGIPDYVQKELTFDTIRDGAEIVGKLEGRHVRGGKVLSPKSYRVNYNTH